MSVRLRPAAANLEIIVLRALEGVGRLLFAPVWSLSLFSLKIDFRIDLLVLYGLLVIEFVQFKDRLQHSNQYLVAQLESSILKLKEKTDNIEDEECVLESMKFGSQVLELASENFLARTDGHLLSFCILRKIPRFAGRFSNVFCYCILQQITHFNLTLVASFTDDHDFGPAFWDEFFASVINRLLVNEPEKYQTHFSEYIKRGIEADDMEELYKKVHAAIRADPTAKKSEKEPPKEHKRYNLKRLTYEMCLIFP
ncbi:hypothetical protein Ancab_012397 [Ancistrocladus abbreviatus]